MASAVLELMYRGKRDAAERLARTVPELDVFEAAAVGALEALIERCEEDAGRATAYAQDGWTALHLAAAFGNTACRKELLRRGAPPDARARNSSAVTPLERARAGNHTAAAAALRAAGATFGQRPP
ncbi:MAG: ankyrin repeat domain-containing protein [Candidatus Velthaea sp.]